MKIDTIGWFGLIYSKLPNLGIELRDFIVKILPLLALIGGILMTLASIAEVLGTPFISVFTLGKSTLIQTLFLTGAIGLVQGILMISAFKSLKKKTLKGWKLMFWSQILWIISSLISLSPSVLLGLVFLYPLFQVKSEYK